MKWSILSAFVVSAALTASPVAAQQSQTETVPLQMKIQTVMQVQQKLNKEGFDAGHADGNWGPQTAEAVKNFQQKNNLPQTGELDQQTLSKLGINMPSSGSSSGSSGGQEQGSSSSSGGQEQGSGGSSGGQQR